jgi:CRISPR system Cascade subunit CasD
MSTLLLRFAAPLQSWGADSKFERRATGREPTKSGVIGMLAAALGRSRNESVDDLANLKFGVRIDKPGHIMRDFHTAKSVKQTYVTHRYYLADAIFLVGLEGNSEFMQKLEEAVLSPFFPVFLGRRSCPPTGKLSLGIRHTTLEDALRKEPLLAKHTSGEPIILVFDTDEIGYHRQRDLPISFNPQHRKFAYRYLNTEVLTMTMHDSFGEVEE